MLHTFVTCVLVQGKALVSVGDAGLVGDAGDGVRTLAIVHRAPLRVP